MTAPSVSPFRTSTTSFALPQRTGSTTPGENGEPEAPSLALLARRENARLYGIQPPDKEYIKHKTDESLSMLTYDA